LAGEFQRLAEPRALTEENLTELTKAELAWREAPSAISASEFVGGALVAGEPERALDAAEFLVSGEEEVLRRLGERLLEPSPTAGLDADSALQSPADLGSTEFFYMRVARQKARLAADPRNPIAWSDLARRYTALGQFDQAEHALGIARSLAPLSRYLLRSAARFYTHIRKPEVAFATLSECPRTEFDPWLMAARLSVGSLAQAKNQSVRTARRLLEDDNFRPIERADLASELATFELRAGSDRKARSLFARSLVAPTDNSLAQVEWASHRMALLEVRLGEQPVAFPAEAYTRSASERGEWEEVLVHAHAWIEDQPFDTAAANMASYACAVGLEDWSRAIAFAQLGLRAQPRDPALLNNLAYALLESGRVEDAATQLSLIDPAAAPRAQRVALLATHGLLQYRLGDPAAGRAGYEAAIKLARQVRNSRAEAMAKALLLREQIGSVSRDDALAMLKEAIEIARKINDPGLDGVVGRVERAMDAVEGGPEAQ
jgi:tetratricopeptide (TPR) repeat protein